ncbi:hypothetical protein PS2_017543 [Malus domestica]
MSVGFTRRSRATTSFDSLKYLIFQGCRLTSPPSSLFSKASRWWLEPFSDTKSFELRRSFTVNQKASTLFRNRF